MQIQKHYYIRFCCLVLKSFKDVSIYLNDKGKEYEWIRVNQLNISFFECSNVQIPSAKPFW